MRSFGRTRDGRRASLWTLSAAGIEIDVTDFGATLVAVRVPDRRGAIADVVLGFDDVAGYESADNQYFGCTVGRVANRIAGAEFVLDGEVHSLAANEGRNHLHGGVTRSFDKVTWRGEAAGDAAATGIRFVRRSTHGEEGYPGNVDVEVEYHLLPGARLRVAISATSDRRTPFNATNHAYWNLAGAGLHTVLDHVLTIAADQITEADAELIPTGVLAGVAGTALDFTTPRPVGARIRELLDAPPRGYDHNFVLRPRGADEPIAELRDPSSGRWMRIATVEPGLQLYTGNHLRGQCGKNGRAYAARSALCLETQHFPDSVHHAHFPTTILEPGRRFATATTWSFGAG